MHRKILQSGFHRLTNSVGGKEKWKAWKLHFDCAVSRRRQFPRKIWAVELLKPNAVIIADRRHFQHEILFPERFAHLHS